MIQRVKPWATFELTPREKIFGSYGNDGVKGPDRLTDIPKLVAYLKQIGVTDHFHLIRNAIAGYPDQWTDFKSVATALDEAGIRLWAYLSPAENGPDPYGKDYITWAYEIALLAREHPSVMGFCIDDFTWNTGTIPPAYCERMMTIARHVAPNLAFLVIGYWRPDSLQAIWGHIQRNVVDGVVFPFILPHENHLAQSVFKLMPQIEDFRGGLDRHSVCHGRHISLFVMPYAKKLSTAEDEPTSEYVNAIIDVSAVAIRKGWADGIVIYGLPFANDIFRTVIKMAYGRANG